MAAMIQDNLSATGAVGCDKRFRAPSMLGCAGSAGARRVLPVLAILAFSHFVRAEGPGSVGFADLTRYMEEVLSHTSGGRRV